MRFIATTLTAISLASVAGAQTGQSGAGSFIDTEGRQVGTATARATNSGVLFEIEVEGLPADGWVALHIHEDGNCDPDSDHASAGGHFSPSGAEHGFLTEGGPHEGDMPNQYVPADGVLRAHVLNTFVGLDDGTAVRGRALVIHAQGDDYSSQPSGDAGDRLACAVIE